MSDSGSPLSADQVDAYLAWSRSAVETGGHPNALLSCRIDGKEFSTVAAARQLAEAAADEPDVLAWLAVSLVEYLVDDRWRDLADELEQAAAESAPFRRALSCCWFDDAVPAEVIDRLLSLIRPEEDIGRSAS